MNRQTAWKRFLTTAALVAGFAGAPQGFGIPAAQAVVGRPASPVSVAGTARRTSRRTVRRTSSYVAALPTGCTTVTIEGAALHQCGSTYYQQSGSQYVVVVVE